jgi:hypothetical protein
MEVNKYFVSKLTDADGEQLETQLINLHSNRSPIICIQTDYQPGI